MFYNIGSGGECFEQSRIKRGCQKPNQRKIGVLFVITLIIGLISGVAAALLSRIRYGNLIVTICITPAFALSIVRVYLDVVKGNRPEVGDAFCGFDDFWSAFKVNFLSTLFVFLWSLLFVIPGIVKSYSYSMAMYILAENPGKPALECIEESKWMTEGHKMELFVLDLSFLGWALLCAITLGIAGIWVLPYMQATYVNAYDHLKNPSGSAE